jgi:DNA-directed RNA polymerase specialized sigma24 family protein
MTKGEQKEDFLKHVAKNFSLIKGLFFAQLPHIDQEDILSDCILKVAERINKKGINLDSDYTAYLFFAYRNTIYTLTKRKQRFFLYECSNMPEGFIDEEEREEALIKRIQEEETIEEIFSFVESNFKPLEASFFKYYHKTKLTYSQIAEATKYSLSYIWQTNNKITKAVKKEFIK